MHADPAPTSSDVHLRIGHLTTVDMSLALLLGTELEVDVEHGHDVFGLSAPGPYVERVEALGVRHVPLTALTRAWDPLRDGRAFFQLVRALRRLDLDVLHTHNPKTGVMGRIAGRLAGVPVVVNTCHGLWASPEDSLAKRTFVYGLESLAARFSDYELFQNAEDEATLRRFLKPGKHRVVGNGVDLTHFTPDPEGRRQVRAELGIGDDELLVGTVGRRVREKGLAEFAEAARTLADRATFVWVGPEDDTDAASANVDTSPISFVVERTDMPAVYSAFDVFVLASHREGFSRASMEAAACGIPMVLADIRGCREIGEDDVHVLLSPGRDPVALTQAVERLLADPGLRRRLGNAARSRALAQFDQSKVASLSLETYEAVGRGKRSASLAMPLRAEDRKAARHLALSDSATDAQTSEGDISADSSDDSYRPKGRDLDAQEGRRITVLHVLPKDRDRGAQMFVGLLRDALRDDPQQHHLALTLFAGPQAAARADVRLGLTEGRLAHLGLDPRPVLALRRAIKEHQADVVVAHGGEALKYVIASRTRSVTIYKRTGLSSAEVSRPSRTILYRRLANRATHVVGVSRALQDQSHNLLGIPHSKTSLIPNSRDPEVYYPPRSERPTDRLPLVLFVGQFERGKRPNLFLDIIGHLRARHLQFSAGMVGSGKLRQAIEKRATALEVELLGSRDDVPDLLRRADIVVLTSEVGSEGMPGILIEAGLTGLPVVATSAAGVEDVVVDGDTGYVVSSQRAEDLAERVAALIDDLHLREDMGNRALARCTAHFSAAATAEAWHRLVAGLVHDVSGSH